MNGVILGCRILSTYSAGTEQQERDRSEKITHASSVPRVQIGVAARRHRGHFLL